MLIQESKRKRITELPCLSFSVAVLARRQNVAKEAEGKLAYDFVLLLAAQNKNEIILSYFLFI